MIFIRRSIVLATVLCLTFLSAPITASIIPNELIVRTRSALPGSRVQSSGTQSSVSGISIPRVMSSRYLTPGSSRTLSTSARRLENVYLLTFSNANDTDSAMASLNGHPDIVYVERNRYSKIWLTPNDPAFTSLQSNLSQVSAPSAWDITTGSTTIPIAIIDTGVQLTHPDLSTQLWVNSGEIVNGLDDDGNGYVDDINGWDFVNNDNNPTDDNGHGTHVAGIASAATNNGVGVASVGFNTRLMILKAGDASGNLSLANIISAVNYAANNGAKVMNMSFGGDTSQAEDDAIQAAISAGVVAVAAAGNEGIDLDSSPKGPASYSNVLTVSAVDSSNSLASFSNTGSAIDVAAPGVSIYSTALTSTYGTSSGTSMAAPHVSGAVALALSYNGSANGRNAIIQSATDLGTAGRDSSFGYGLLNVQRAVASVDTTPPVINSVQSITSSTHVSISVTANITDNLSDSTYPIGSIRYQYLGGDVLSADVTTASMSKSGNVYSGTIPTPPNEAVQVTYFVNAVDQNPSNSVNSSTTTIQLPDIAGPTYNISESLEGNDYFSLSETVTINVLDNVAVSTNSLSISAAQSSGSGTSVANTLTFTPTSTGVSFSGGVLLLDLGSMGLSEGLTTFTISGSDATNNSTSFSFTLNLSNTSTSNLRLFGPEGDGGKILNLPNPFNPAAETTLISFQCTTNASITFYVYSLRGRLIRKWSQDVTAGYHEVEWDGRNSGGDIVSNGVYVVVMKAVGNGQTARARVKVAVLR